MSKNYNFDKQIIELFTSKEKYSKTQIAKICGCSTETVNRALERAGLKEIKLIPALQAIELDVIEDFNNGLYCKDIAGKY